MKFYLSRDFRINMGNYEHTNLSAGAGINHNDLGISTDELLRMTQGQRDQLFDDIADYAADKLNKIQLPSLEEIVSIAPRESFVRRLGQKQEPNPRRVRG